MFDWMTEKKEKFLSDIMVWKVDEKTFVLTSGFGKWRAEKANVVD